MKVRTTYVLNNSTIYTSTTCVVIPFILDVRFVDAPSGVTQEEGPTGSFFHLPSAVLATTGTTGNNCRSDPS